MAKPLPKASSRRKSVGKAAESPKTPFGVWVVVGIAILFSAGGIATGIFVGLRSLGEKSSASAQTSATEALQTPTGPHAEPAKPPPSAGSEVPLAPREDGDVSPPTHSNPGEQEAMRQEVLNRIDLMRFLSQTGKDKLYAQVERAKGFQKIAVISFPKNGSTPDAGQIGVLVRRLKEPEMQKLLGDPTVLLIMVGFADAQGDESRNLEVSRARAESVIKALREKIDLVNVMHSVGMGGQTLFDQANPEKNRLVEVWAVQS